MKVLGVAGVIALSVLILQAEDRQFSLSAFGVGPITLHTALTHEGDNERLIVTAKNESGTALQRARICVRAFESSSECLFELSNTALWAPGVELNWSLTTPRKLAKLPHYATIEQLDVAKTTEAATTSARPPQAPPIPVPAVAPDKQGFTEPEFEGVFFRLVAGNLVALERAPLKASVVALTVKRAWDIAGGTSPVRFRAGEEVEFVVRARNATADPTFAYDLRKLVTKRAVREVKACFRGRYAEPQVFDCPFFLPLRFSRYGSSSYKITTPALPPGEYALRQGTAESVFCFGVRSLQIRSLQEG